MTAVVAALRRTRVVIRPALQGWRLLAAPAVAILLVAGLLAAHFHPAGLFGGSSASQGTASRTGGPGAAGNAGGPGNGSGAGGVGGSISNGQGTAAPAGGSNGAGKGSSTPAPAHTPFATPTPTDTIYGKADVLQSDCADGYEPGQVCTVYYHGVYDLISQSAGKVVFEVVIDGVPANSQAYVAPGGAHRFGGNLKFTVPPHAKQIIYDCMLEDATGKVIIKSAPQTTYGYG